MHIAQSEMYTNSVLYYKLDYNMLLKGTRQVNLFILEIQNEKKMSLVSYTFNFGVISPFF